MRRRSGSLALLGILGVCFGVSCAGSSGDRARLPWMDHGARVGTIHVIADGKGDFYDYRDRKGRLIRRERHLRGGELDPSSAIASYGYDEAGHETRLSFTDAHGRAVLGPPGFATRRTARRPDGKGWLVDYRYYDASGTPMMLPSGYFHEEVQIDADGFVERRRFYDTHEKPAAAHLEFGKGTFEVRYKRLMGTTPVVYETYFDLAGEPTAKRRISGSTTSKWVTHREYDYDRSRY